MPRTLEEQLDQLKAEGVLLPRFMLRWLVNRLWNRPDIERARRDLSNADPTARSKAVWIVASTRDYRAAELLLPMLDDPDVNVCVLTRGC